MKTTVQISENLRRRLKVLSSYRDMSYEEILDDLITVFEGTIPFKTKGEFSEWFEKNIKLLGFKKIVEKRARGFPDYRLEDKGGKMRDVELELVAGDFLRHGHDPKKVDLIVSVFSTEDEISGVPVLPIIKTPENPEDLKNLVPGRSTIVSIPTGLHKKVKELINGTGFENVSEFVNYVLRTILLEAGKEEVLTKKDLKRVKKKLKALGYW